MCLRASSPGSRRRNPSRPRSRSRQPAEKPQEQTQPPRFRADVNLVRVDAYPLRDGKPVFDLKAEEFEVFEDGVLQKIATFEHVVVRPAGPQTERMEVSSQRESLQAVANPRNRVFVIFLDTPNVSVESAHAINEPLIRLMDRILGPDDLVGVMTPAMAASQVVLGRKTQVIEDSLRRNWPWGTRFSIMRDAQEDAYNACYPPNQGEGTESPVAREMIARKRERATLEALEDLVRYLRTVREERKAILTVTEGWLLYRENPGLTKLRKDPLTGQTEPIPGVDPVGVGPTGQLTTKDPRRNIGGSMTKSECDTDRMRLAAMDNRKFFLDLLADANRGNASFYPIDPRGLPVFDNPIGPAPPPPINIDRAMLKERIENLRTLAENTDGIAVVNNNDLDKGLKRISDDLTSVLSPRLLLDQSQARWAVPHAESARQAARRSGSRAPWLSRRDRSGGHCSQPRCRRPSPRGHPRHQRGNRPARTSPPRHAVPDQRRHQRGPQALALGCRRAAVAGRTS